MVLPNLPPIDISVDEVRQYLEEEGAIQPQEPDEEPLTDDSIVGWRRTLKDPNDESKGWTCVPLLWGEYKEIRQAMAEQPHTIIQSRYDAEADA